jgi:hypothetical protein
LIRLYNHIYSFREHSDFNKDFKKLIDKGEVVLDFELGENYISVYYQPEKNKFEKNINPESK